jgi:DNA-binding MarR family transcriptional regulator
MIKSDSSTRATDLAALEAAIPRWQDAVTRYDEAVGAALGLGPSERLCLAALAGGPVAPKDLATAVRRTPAAVTALLDRLETRGLVERRPDPRDRRRLLVAMTPAAETLARHYYGGIAERGRAFLESYGDAELGLLRRFVEGLVRLQEDEIEALASRNATN